MNATRLDVLDSFAAKRPGFDPSNYADWDSIRADRDYATRQLRDYRVLATACRAFNIEPMNANRIEFVPRGDSFEIDFTPCQYPPMEFRAAACRACSSALWGHVREAYPHLDGDGIRAHFKRWFGLGIQRRWFR